MEKHIEIDGKDYVLTPTRKIIKSIYSVAPNAVDVISGLKSNLSDKEITDATVEIIANLDLIFFELLNNKYQPNITKEDSDLLLDKFNAEYDGVDNAIINLALSAFTEGKKGSAKKKKINW